MRSRVAASGDPPLPTASSGVDGGFAAAAAARATELFGYDERLASRDERRASGATRLLGIGVALTEKAAPGEELLRPLPPLSPA